MKSEKGKQSLPENYVRSNSSPKIARAIIEKLNASPDKMLPYSVLYKSGRRDLLKREILNLESEGKIRVLPMRVRKNEMSDLRFVVHIQSTDKPAASEILKPLMEKFDSCTSLEGKLVVLNKIEYRTRKDHICNQELIWFLAQIIKDEKYQSLHYLSITALENILDYSIRFQVEPLLNEISKLRQDKGLISRLEGLLLDDSKRDPQKTNTKVRALNVLCYLSPKDNLDVMLHILEHQSIFTLPDHFSRILIESQRRAGADKFKIIRLCERELKEGDVEKKQVAKIIIGDI